jgi:hypothetical protein
LHPHERVHLHAEGFLDTKGHVAGQGENAGALPEGNFHLGIAAGGGGIHGGNDPVKVLPHKPPRRVAKNNDGDSPTGKVLLIAHVLVGRQQQIEAGAIGQLKQLSV